MADKADQATRDADRVEQIRQRAHAIWEREGRPHGRDAEHWRQAEAELDAEGGEVGGAQPTAPETGAAGPAADRTARKGRQRLSVPRDPSGAGSGGGAVTTSGGTAGTGGPPTAGVPTGNSAQAASPRRRQAAKR
jgi:hypothetical protein